MTRFEKDLINLEACDDEMEIALSYNFDVRDERCLTSHWMVIWLASKKQKELNLKTNELITYGIKAARIVSVFNNSPKVIEAIEAAERCLEYPAQENIQAAEAAAWAAEAAEAAARAAAWAARAAEIAAAVEAAGAIANDNSEAKLKLKELFSPLRQKLIDYYLE